MRNKSLTKGKHHLAFDGEMKGGLGNLPAIDGRDRFETPWLTARAFDYAHKILEGTCAVFLDLWCFLLLFLVTSRPFTDLLGSPYTTNFVNFLSLRPSAKQKRQLALRKCLVFSLLAASFVISLRNIIVVICSHSSKVCWNCGNCWLPWRGQVAFMHPYSSNMESYPPNSAPFFFARTRARRNFIRMLQTLCKFVPRVLLAMQFSMLRFLWEPERFIQAHNSKLLRNTHHWLLWARKALKTRTWTLGFSLKTDAVDDIIHHAYLTKLRWGQSCFHNWMQNYNELHIIENLVLPSEQKVLVAGGILLDSELIVNDSYWMLLVSG